MPIMIYLPKKYANRTAKKQELINEGTCRKCGQPYKWRVQNLRQFGDIYTEDEYNQTRAMALFEEYRQKGIGYCCAAKEHRTFIANNVGAVVYE